MFDFAMISTKAVAASGIGAAAGAWFWALRRVRAAGDARALFDDRLGDGNDRFAFKHADAATRSGQCRYG